MGREASRDLRLLVLGLLRDREMHGYQVAESVTSRVGGAHAVKTPTLYDTLKRLRAEGLVESREEQAGNRPSRAVYRLTTAGEREFMELLREAIGTFREPELAGDVALAFIDALPVEQARALLSARAEALLDTIDDMLTGEVPDTGVRLMSSRRSHHLLAESAWMEEALDGLGEESVERGDLEG